MKKIFKNNLKENEVKLIEEILSNDEIFFKTRQIIDSKYFEDDVVGKIYEFATKHHDKTNVRPRIEFINREFNIDLKEYKVTEDEVDKYLCDVEEFCKEQHFASKAEEIFGFAEKQEYDRIIPIIEKISEIKLKADFGYDYTTESARERLERQLLEEKGYSTGIITLDKMLSNESLCRGMLYMFSANSGEGKSLWLANLCVNSFLLNKRALYISLELSTDLVASRFDAMITGINPKEALTSKENILTIDGRIQKARDLAKDGHIIIEQLESGARIPEIVGVIESYISKYDCAPDVLYLDYLDLVGADGTFHNIAEKDKVIAEGVRNIGVRYKMPVVSASQQNRDAIGTDDTTQANIAGGLPKVNTSDFWFSIFAGKELMDDGRMRLKCLKARGTDSKEKTAEFAWDPIAMRITDVEHNKTLTMKLKKISKVEIDKDKIEKEKIDDTEQLKQEDVTDRNNDLLESLYDEEITIDDVTDTEVDDVEELRIEEDVELEENIPASVRYGLDIFDGIFDL